MIPHAVVLAIAAALPIIVQAQAPAKGPGKEEQLVRGRYLVEGIAACGNCHFQRDPTGKPLVDRGFNAGNLTFDLKQIVARSRGIADEHSKGVDPFNLN